MLRFSTIPFSLCSQGVPDSQTNQEAQGCTGQVGGVFVTIWASKKTVFEHSSVVSVFKPKLSLNNVLHRFSPLGQTLGRNIMHYVNAYIEYKYSTM